MQMHKEEILKIARLYHRNANEINDLHGGHNKVYAISGDNINFVLRLSLCDRRSSANLLGEIDFQSYLSQNGVNVVAPLKNLNESYLCECQLDGISYFATAFELSRASNFMEREPDGEKLYVSAGKELGKIHYYSKKYVPSPGIRPRFQWYKNTHLASADMFSQNVPTLAAPYNTFKQKMLQMDKNKESYGLIHGDFFFANFLSHKNHAIVIDFDECEYNWYLYDIAVCMYYQLIGANPKHVIQKQKEAAELFKWLMEGYLQETSLDTKLIKYMQHFFWMRDYVLLATMAANAQLSPWQKDLYDTAFQRVTKHQPLVDIDFSCLL